MTPKEKAKELYHKFQVYEVNGLKHMKYGPEVKVFTLIAIDEIIEAIDWHEFETPNEQWNYWQQVKQEIENL
jgi:protein associated with RNAse G/E